MEHSLKHRISWGLGIVAGVILGGCASEAEPPAAAPVEAAADAASTQGATSPAPAGPAGEPADDSTVIATFGGQTLTENQIVAELKRLPARSRAALNPETRGRFVENYVLNELLYAEGLSRGFGDDAEIDRQVRDLRKRLVVQQVVRELQDPPEITDADIQKSYDDNPARYSTTTVKARHILVKEKKEADDLRAKLLADPSQFADLAREHSTDKASARKGGELGFFGHGRMVPEFEDVAFALEEGGLSEVVKTAYGYHIIQLQERREGKQKTLDQVKDQIRAVLKNQRIRERSEAFYAEVQERAKVEIDKEALEAAAAKIPPPTAEELRRFHGGH